MSKKIKIVLLLQKIYNTFNYMSEQKIPYVSSRRQFHRFKNNVLVESGTLLGDGIADALDSGYTKVISFEVAPDLVKSCRNRFKDNPNVQVVEDTSANLYEYIKDIKEPITFWLDGHWSQGITSYKDVYCPVLLELEQISKHPIKTHTILVDDVRLFGTWEFNHITLADVIKKATEINPKYKIDFLDGHQANDILAFSI